MQDLIQSLPPAAQNYLKPETPVTMKMMAASGRLPLPPNQLGIVMYGLCHDENPQVAQSALDNFRQQPTKILMPLLSHPKADAALLHFFAYYFSHDAKILEQVVLHRQTPNEIIAQLAQQLKDPLLGLIVQNQQRQLEHPPIVHALLHNTNLNNSQRTRVLEFALRQGIETGYNEEMLSRFIHPALLKELLRSRPAPATKADKELELQFENEFADDEDADFLAPEFMDDFDDDEEVEEEEGKKLTIEQQILNWSVSEKIVAAKRGNKQIRSILIRDGNKLVSTGVLDNPRITEGEVLKIAASRSVSEEIIRIITRNREWMKLYQMKVNLTANPKCPTPVAIRLLNHLRLHDLRNLAGNKNVPSVVATNARKLSKQRGPT